jgi:hypothetical protein
MNRPSLGTIADMFAQSQQELGIDCRLESFQDDSWIDPLTKWSMDRIPVNGKVKWVIILHDWMPKRYAGDPAPGSVEENVSYCQDWYEKPWEAKAKARAEALARAKPGKKNVSDGLDATFTNLFWSWPRPLLEAKQCLVMNAVWGIRKEGGKAPLSVTYRRAKQIIYKPIVDWANPQRIYVVPALQGWFSDPPVREICHPSKRDWLFQLAMIGDPRKED